MPFESANLRIIKKWCSNKLALDRFDPAKLIQTIKKYKINVASNYMIGFPDETRSEIESTVNLAKQMHDDTLLVPQEIKCEKCELNMTLCARQIIWTNA